MFDSSQEREEGFLTTYWFWEATHLTPRFLKIFVCVFFRCTLFHICCQTNVLICKDSILLGVPERDKAVR